MKNDKIKPNTKKKYTKSSTYLQCKKKNKLYQNIIQETILSTQKYKSLDIIDAASLNICTQSLENVFIETNNINTILSNKKNMIDYDTIINKLQKINNELSVNFRSYGTQNIENLLLIIFGKDYINKIVTSKNKNIYDVIKKYTHPISYKILEHKQNNEKNKKLKHKILAKNRIIEDFMIVESATTLDCYDLARTGKKFQVKVYGIKICFQNLMKKKTLIVSAIADDMIISCSNLQFFNNKILLLHKEKPQDTDFNTEDFSRFVDSPYLKRFINI